MQQSAVSSRGLDPIRESAITRAVEQMRRRLADPLHLTDLARVAAFSPFHFHRLFREYTEMTPARFLAALRMAEARRRLLHSQITVTAISAQVGYTSAGTFTTQFTRLVGTSPANFRRLARAVQREPGRSIVATTRPHSALPGGEDRLLVEVSDGQAGELVLVGVRAAGSGPDAPTTWAIGSGTVSAPVGRDAGPQEVRVLAVHPDATLTQALVDEVRGSYRLGTATVTVPYIGCARLPVTTRPPRVIDPPPLAIGPICRPAERLLAARAGVSRRSMQASA